MCHSLAVAMALNLCRTREPPLHKTSKHTDGGGWTREWGDGCRSEVSDVKQEFTDDESTRSTMLHPRAVGRERFMQAHVGQISLGILVEIIVFEKKNLLFYFKFYLFKGIFEKIKSILTEI